MNAEKRAHTRAKVSVPIELTPEGSQTPLRTEIADLSVRGCYIEMLFTLPVGTEVKSQSAGWRFNDLYDGKGCDS